MRQCIHKSRTIILLWCLLLSLSLQGDDIPVRFSSSWTAVHYSREKGLPYHDINEVLQDRFGLLYFNGWGRGFFLYDGQNWELFSSRNAGLKDNIIISMAYDGRDYIYLGHYENGVSRFNIIDHSVTHLVPPEKLVERMSLLLLLPGEKLLIMTFGNSYFIYDIHTGQLERLESKPTTFFPSAFRWESGRSALVDSRGRCWIGTEAGLLLYSGEKAMDHYPFEGDTRQLICGIYEDSTGRIHVAADHFMGILDEEEKIIKPSPLTLFDDRLKEVNASHKKPFYQDEFGVFYLFTQEGVLTFDPVTGESYEFNKENGFLVHNFINVVFRDREKNIWIGTQDGVTRLFRSPFRSALKLGNLHISAVNTVENEFCQFQNSYRGGWLYFSDSRKAYELLGEKAREIDLSAVVKPGSLVWDIFPVDDFTGERKIFVNCSAGLYSYDRTTRTYKPESGLPPEASSFVAGDYKYFLYYNGMVPGSALRQNLVTRERVQVEIPRGWSATSPPSPLEGFLLAPSNPDEAVFISPGINDRSFYCNFSRGIFFKNFFLESIKTVYPGEYLIRDIVAGRDRDFWISMHTPKGRIFHYADGTISDYTAFLGTEDMIIEDMKMTPRGNLLIATGTNGLIVYNDEEAAYYKSSFGLPSDRLAAGIGIGTEEDIYLLSQSELILFDETNLLEPVVTPWFYKAENPQGNLRISLLPLAGDQTVVFDPSIRDLIFFLSVGSYISENDISYQFRLSGRSEWTLKDEKNIYTLSNLGPGTYTLEARIFHSAGKQEQRTLKFKIPPYWYETLLFRVLVIMLAGGGAVLGLMLGVRWNTRRLKEKASELETMVKERTKELTKTQDLLVESALVAGKAEIAEEILHNAGNILTSINVSLERMASGLEDSNINKLFKANELLQAHREEFLELLDGHEIGLQLIDYYLALGKVLKEEKEAFAKGIMISRNHTRTLIDFIHSQEKFARKEGLYDECSLTGLVDRALAFYGTEISALSIRITKEYDPAAGYIIHTHRGKVLTVLSIIFCNAIDSLKGVPVPGRFIIINISRRKDELLCVIRDTGMGIARENLNKIFQSGFTTKKNSSGFSLHTCANYMKSLKGRIEVDSEGLGRGAVFSLYWPL